MKLEVFGAVLTLTNKLTASEQILILTLTLKVDMKYDPIWVHILFYIYFNLIVN